MQDEDFVADKDDGGSPTDDSGEEESDASESGGEKEVAILFISLGEKIFYMKFHAQSLTKSFFLQKPAKKEPKKESASLKVSSSKKKSKDGDEDGKKKKQKKKKDPNAPKRAMSGFMFFSQMEREVQLLSL